MKTLRAELADVAGGRVAIALPIDARLSQQDGFLHGGVVVAVHGSAQAVLKAVHHGDANAHHE